MNIFCRLPHVVCFRVSMPLDQVLKLLVVSMILVTADLLHFIFCFSVNKVRWWLGKVGPVGGHFAIG
jgi:hypothetical protein